SVALVFCNKAVFLGADRGRAVRCCDLPLCQERPGDDDNDAGEAARLRDRGRADGGDPDPCGIIQPFLLTPASGVMRGFGCFAAAPPPVVAPPPTRPAEDVRLSVVR